MALTGSPSQPHLLGSPCPSVRARYVQTAAAPSDCVWLGTAASSVKGPATTDDVQWGDQRGRIVHFGHLPSQPLVPSLRTARMLPSEVVRAPLRGAHRRF